MKAHVQSEIITGNRQPCGVRIQYRYSAVISRLAGKLLWILPVVFVGPAVVFGDEPASFDAIGIQYERDVRSLLKLFCVECHSTKQKEGELDLQRFGKFDSVRRDPQVWQKVGEMLRTGEMPPEDSKQPSPKQKKELRGWIRRYLHAEAVAHAGDPGPVVLRRLNNAEYTYTIRDLTGVDLNPAREFPADSAAGEGFTNTGNSLVMSPALLRKYLDAGKAIAQHAVLLPDGFRFSPHTTQRDWTDGIVAPIRNLYGEFVTSTDLGVGTAVGSINLHINTRLGLAGRLSFEKYFAATLIERDALTTGTKTIEAVAGEHGLNARYLGTLWSSLSGSNPSLLLDGLRSRWRTAKPEDAAALAADVAVWQRGLWMFSPIGLIGRARGPSRWMEPINPLVTQQEMRFKIPAPAVGEKKKPDGKKEKEVVISLVATDAGDGNEHDFVVWQRPRLVAKGRSDVLLRDVKDVDLDPAKFGKHPNSEAIDAASLCVRAPSVITIRLPASLAAGRDLVTTAVLDKKTGREGSVQVGVVAGTPTPKSGLLTSQVVVKFSTVTVLFSEHRNVSFVRPILVSEKSTARSRIESAMDEYRSLFPDSLCYTQIVPVDLVHTTTLFYREDDHLARLMLDDVQKARLDRLWDELRFVSRSDLKRVEVLEQLLEELARTRRADHDAQYNLIKVLHKPFKKRATEFRKELIDAESKHVDALVDFAARAYRRPLTGEETNELRGLYHRLRKQELPHDEAFRLTLARVFVASPFLYRLEKAPAGTVPAAVSDWELASRLSYFLWSSMPDKKLRAAAETGRLTSGDVSIKTNAELRRQTQRMLKDPRVRRLAIEFAGQWLHIHAFDPLVEKSEKHFPEFAELRGDMYEESNLFFTNLFQRDDSLLSLLNADHTFVNERLAKFYGIEGVKGTAWRRVEGMRKHGRGGILGLSATLAKQSGISRTSPILRGNWVSEVLLGERLPRPPKNVPQLADTVPAGLTERQLIEKHSSDTACAKCHQRIDPFGFALEGFDAIGRRRDRDLAGRPIDTKTKLPDGSEIDGLPGLRKYLLVNRRDIFLRQFCRKLMGYAIGRESQLSDEPLLTEMQHRLAKNGYRFSVAVDMIVQSRQFREIREKSFRP